MKTLKDSVVLLGLWFVSVGILVTVLWMMTVQ